MLAKLETFLIGFNVTTSAAVLGIVFQYLRISGQI